MFVSANGIIHTSHHTSIYIPRGLSDNMHVSNHLIKCILSSKQKQ